MDVTEENVQMLLNMGFDELDIRRALKIAKNDLSEAVAILTNDHPVTSFDTLQDVEMKPDEIQPLKGSVPPISYGPSLPPSYEQSIETGSVSANVNVSSPTGNLGTSDEVILVFSAVFSGVVWNYHLPSITAFVVCRSRDLLTVSSDQINSSSLTLSWDIDY